MSNIAKKPIVVPSGVTVTQQETVFTFTGPKGNASYVVPEMVTVTSADKVISVAPQKQNDRQQQAMAGLTRANLANVIKGVDSGFEKKLELAGVGYRAQMQGADLVLSLGFSHPVKFRPLDGLTISVTENVITITGIDKTLVGQMAAQIRAVKPPEPYKGKGITYAGERVRRKAGKAAKAAGAK